MATMRVALGDDEHFDFVGLKASEMAQVRGWCGAGNRRDLWAAVVKEDPDTLRALKTLVKRRDGAPELKFRDVDVDLDSVRVFFVAPDGRECEAVVETDDEGNVVKDEDGDPVPLKDDRGQMVFRYADTGEMVEPEDPTTGAS